MLNWMPRYKIRFALVTLHLRISFSSLVTTNQPSLTSGTLKTVTSALPQSTTRTSVVFKLETSTHTSANITAPSTKFADETSMTTRQSIHTIKDSQPTLASTSKSTIMNAALTTETTTPQSTTKMSTTLPRTNPTTVTTHTISHATNLEPSTTTNPTTTTPIIQSTTTRSTIQSTTTTQTTTISSTTHSTTSSSTTHRPTTKLTTNRPTTQTTTRTTTIRSTTLMPSTHSTSVPIQLGNTALCPALIRQYAQQDNEILTQMGSNCYSVVLHRASWFHAEYVCKQRGGHLFSVEDSGQNLFFYILLNTRFNHSVWMGLHDFIHEEHFQWDSGIPVNYTNWIPGRKNNFYSHHDEDCVVLIPYKNHGQWDDIPCGSTHAVFESFHETHYFICQFPVSTTAQAIHTGQTDSINNCPGYLINAVNSEGGHLAYYDHHCYERVPQLRTWTDAEHDCQRKQGHLVQIGSAKEQSFLEQFLSNFNLQHQVWIGLHDRGHEETFTWTSGENVTYINWMPGRQNNVFHHNFEDCAVLVPSRQGQWDDLLCYTLITPGSIFGRTEVNPYICEYKTHGLTSATTHAPVAQHVQTGCPSSVVTNVHRGHYTHYDMKCYEYIPAYRTWTTAEWDCHNNGGHLLTIKSAQEETFILQFLARFHVQHQVWIGLHDRGHEENFTWVSGEHVTYTNWMPGRKNNHYSASVEDCTALLPSQHSQWDDMICGKFAVHGGTHHSFGLEVNPYICEYNAVAVPPVRIVVGKRN